MKIEISGDCLKRGSSYVEVRSSDKFSLFVHEDSCPPINIPLDINNITVENHLVSLIHQGRVDIVEHLFSALYGLGLFNVRIDVHGNELPFFDGSSRVYVEKLKTLVSDNKLRGCTATEKVLVSHGSSFLIYEPLEQNRLVVDMELFHPFIGIQKINLEIDEKTYISEIAPSRTFVFTDESDPRLKDLPPYGIGITKSNVYSSEPLRYKDELVRHKILDLLGDLYVLRKKIFGRIAGRNTSHLLNLTFAHKLLDTLVHIN